MQGSTWAPPWRHLRCWPFSPPWRWEQHPLQTWTSFDPVVIVGCLYNPPSGVVCGPRATQQPENWRWGKTLSPIPSVHLRASWALPLGSSPSPQQVQHYLRMVTGPPASLPPFVISHIWGECPSSSRHCAGCRAYNRDVFSTGPQSPARVESQGQTVHWWSMMKTRLWACGRNNIWFDEFHSDVPGAWPTSLCSQFGPPLSGYGFYSNPSPTVSSCSLLLSLVYFDLLPCFSGLLASNK